MHVRACPCACACVRAYVWMDGCIAGALARELLIGNQARRRHETMPICTCTCTCTCPFAHAHAYRGRRHEKGAPPLVVVGRVDLCMYACMLVCMYACTYACMLVCMYACMLTCWYVRMHVCMHAGMHACMYIHVHLHLDMWMLHDQHMSSMSMHVCIPWMYVYLHEGVTCIVCEDPNEGPHQILLSTEPRAAHA